MIAFGACVSQKCIQLRSQVDQSEKPPKTEFCGGFSETQPKPGFLGVRSGAIARMSQGPAPGAEVSGEPSFVQDGGHQPTRVTCSLLAMRRSSSWKSAVYAVSAGEPTGRSQSGTPTHLRPRHIASTSPPATIASEATSGRGGHRRAISPSIRAAVTGPSAWNATTRLASMRPKAQSQQK